MSKNSAIEWTGSSWNPWSGCTKVTAGCDNCYMFTLKKRWGKDPERVERSKTTFSDPLRWKAPELIFTCSMSDFFHVDADPWRDEAWEIIRNTPQHTYQILTKRPGRIHRHLPADWGDGYPHVWLGTTVENQKSVHRAWRIGDIPARVHFISAEPLLSFIDFANAEGKSALDRIQWVIVGGESGPGYRPMNLDWAQCVVDQCAEKGVKVFMKQDSGPKAGMRGRIPDELWLKEYPISRPAA